MEAVTGPAEGGGGGKAVPQQDIARSHAINVEAIHKVDWIGGDSMSPIRVLGPG